MSPSDGTPNLLPEELDRALRRATDRTLSALTSLRRAVRDHVQSERDKGTSLSEIENEMRILIARAQESVKNEPDGHHEALSTQMIKWTGGFFEEEN